MATAVENPLSKHGAIVDIEMAKTAVGFESTDTTPAIAGDTEQSRTAGGEAYLSVAVKVVSISTPQQEVSAEVIVNVFWKMAETASKHYVDDKGNIHEQHLESQTPLKIKDAAEVVPLGQYRPVVNSRNLVFSEDNPPQTSRLDDGLYHVKYTFNCEICQNFHLKSFPFVSTA
jgi:hypothetical protein